MKQMLGQHFIDRHAWPCPMRWLARRRGKAKDGFEARQHERKLPSRFRALMDVDSSRKQGDDFATLFE